ncbi:MAG TPA: YCF48-related protein [Candidatus Acidoferrum sp.]|nr:YCF48-related protein [Candidatus Acidoferrum sp.]
MLMKGKWIGALAFGLAAAVAAPAQTWRQVGPPGGTVISLEADPKDSKKLYLGTSDGHVFSSTDEGQHWQLLSRIGTGQDDVVTHIIVDSRNSNHLYASTWTLYSGGGGVYKSDDAGRSWHIIGLQKETVRALAQSPTNPKVWVAGSLTGVYRSNNDGNSWERISPLNHDDLRNFDSVAFDPKDENIIYAGTYHLPWKTVDGGKNWTSIKAGMIDDSDVMTMIVDPANPSNVHATACSGIYRSVNGGENWKRYGGIPFVYRRTQLIRQDPQHPDVLYAGTTSGLWKTANEGADNWKRMTPLEWVVNAIVIDPKNPNRLIIGTERQGVQISEDGGATFSAANNGFHHQHILDVAMDNDRPERALVVLTFDTNAFIATKDGGTTWTTLGPGLKRTDLKHVYAAPTGWVASLNAGGLMKYEEPTNKWVKYGSYVGAAAQPVSQPTTKGKAGAAAAKRPAAKVPAGASKPLSFQVNDLYFTNNAWFAATSGGVLISQDKGATWRSASSDPFAKQATQSVEASLDGSQIWALAQRNLLYSSDSGKHWEAKELNFAPAGNLHLHKVDDSNLYLTSNMGLYVSRDAGRNWNRADVRDLQFQDVAGSGSALVASLQKHGLLESHDAGKSWQRVNDPVAEGYFPVLQARRNGSVVAASATEGILSFETGARAAANDGGGR